MTVPVDQEFPDAVVVESQQAIYDYLINAGTSGCFVRIYDANDIKLAAVPLDDPPGSVNGTTGQITLTATSPDSSAAATGTAAYCEIHTSVQQIVVRLPCEAGTATVSKRLVLNTLDILEGAEVSVSSITIG
jgi:hypothetical protein